jgi:endogenous inhibitor of DNA gyrase (YacG/DUF329 family)
MQEVKASTIETIEVECPECGEYVEIDESEFEFADDEKQKTEVHCEECEHKFIAIHPDY